MMKIKNNYLRAWRNGCFAAILSPCLLMGNPGLSDSKSSALVEQQNTEWTLVAESEGVKAFAQLSQCGSDGQAVYLIKLENSSDRTVAVSYSVNVLNDPTSGAVSNEVKLGPASSAEGSCTNETLMAYAPIDQDAGLAQLNVQILTINLINDEN